MAGSTLDEEISYNCHVDKVRFFQRQNTFPTAQTFLLTCTIQRVFLICVLVSLASFLYNEIFFMSFFFLQPLTSGIMKIKGGKNMITTMLQQITKNWKQVGLDKILKIITGVHTQGDSKYVYKMTGVCSLARNQTKHQYERVA